MVYSYTIGNHTKSSAPCINNIRTTNLPYEIVRETFSHDFPQFLTTP